MKRILVPLILIAGFNTFAQDIPGHYVLEGVRETASELFLRPPGTFEYTLIYGAADFSAKGAWRYEKGFVVLNSVSDGRPAFRLVQSRVVRSPGIRVRVHGAGGRPVENIEVALRTKNGLSEGRTAEGGIAKFSDVRGAAVDVVFRVPVYQFESERFPLNSAHNDFEFEINGEAIMQVHFKDERLQVDGTSLELRYWNKNEPFRYRKQ